MASNMSVILNANYLVEDNTVSPSAYIVNRLRSFLSQMATVVYDPAYIAGPTPFQLLTTIPNIQVALIVNLSTSQNVNLQVTPYGGTPQTYVLQPATVAGQPGGMFLYMNPQTYANLAVGSIGALGLSSSGSTAACEILLAG